MPDSRFPLIILPTLLIACLCIYGIILQPGATFGGMDFLNLGFPRVFLARNSLAEGYLPLWNWFEWGGVPLLASLLGALLYPPTWAAMALPLPYGLQAFTFAHLLFAGIGAAYAGRKLLGLSAIPAATCGIVYMGNAFWPGRVEQFQVVAVNSMLPWLTLALHSTLNGGSGRLWLPLTWCASLLAGHPQFAALNMLGAALIAGIPYLLSVRNAQVTQHRKVTTNVLYVAGGILLGTCMAAMQLFPTWELGQLSERIWPYAEPTHPQLEWNHLPALIIPGYYNFLTGQEGRVFGYTEMGLYAGLLTIPLAILGLINGIRREGGLRLTALTVSVAWLLAVIFALGANTFLAPWFFKYVPFFSQSRGAARSLNIAAFALALLSARGFMALMQFSVLSQGIRKLSISTAVLLMITGDLALTHYASIKDILVPTAALAVKPSLPQSDLNQVQQKSHRIYRFMASDSDLYINNSPGAVAERQIRIQPNMNSLSGIALVDGYEEGLLPTRNRANLLRRYNRNLRNDSPDTALLAFLGAKYMLTEFPLPGSNDWEPVLPAFVRPGIVPPVMGAPAAYTFRKSAYNPALLLDPSLLQQPNQPAGEFFDQVGQAFPVVETERVPAGTQWRSHPVEAVSPDEIAVASSPYKNASGFNLWNRLTASIPGGTTRTLVMIPSYPGWNATSEKDNDLLLKYLSSIFYMVESPVKDEAYHQITLTFSPFSVRIGLFISLLAILLFSQSLCFRLIRQNLTKNYYMDKP